MFGCPFKAPAVISLSFGKREVPSMRFDQIEGLSFSSYRFSTDATETFTVWPFKSFSQIVFVLRGKIDFSFPIIGARTAKTGEWFALSINNQQMTGTFSGDVELAVIECSSEIWQGLANEKDTFSHTRRACLGCSQRTETIFLKSQMDSSVTGLAKDLASAQGNNPSELLLIQAKTLELLSLVSRASPLDHTPQKDPCSRKDDHNSIAAAANYLEDNLAADHSLAGLSRQVSLNEFKLKKGFRDRFGVTVFGYLRQKRMEHARELLKTRDSTVLEVANTVGYSNPSHFTRAFRGAFGINPKVFISDSRR
ncbi:MAG: helix-turn-helix transcriptional regulator [Proteobacteria bacterium]|nr:helix-turn-helix transcriptional regulator [Pseudomonadota bacterium]